MVFKSFIETQFPVSKLSKESYKERTSVGAQTLTGLGKWWGRKPLVLVRAIIVGLLMPASVDPDKDRSIFLKIMTMDEEGLWRRKDKILGLQKCMELALSYEVPKLFLQDEDEKWNWLKTTDRDYWEREFFKRIPSLDEKLTYCCMPEHIDGPSPDAWVAINEHLSTTADSIQQLVEQLGVKQFGRIPSVGDAFSGGGSIPFEAARIGCQSFGSDLNPAASLLTWCSLHLLKIDRQRANELSLKQQTLFDEVESQITKWGIEHNEKGWRAEAYLYCAEMKSPSSSLWVPLAPSWVIADKSKTIARIYPNYKNGNYDINIISGVTDTEYEEAKIGTIKDSELIDPQDKNKRYSIKSLRGDGGDNPLRLWENEDIIPRHSDVIQDRLYCIRYVESFYIINKKKGKENLPKALQGKFEFTMQDANAIPDFSEYISDGFVKEQIRRHYVSPSEYELRQDQQVCSLLKQHFKTWQEKGFIPNSKIPAGGDKTDEPIRTRGYTYWHHLFNPRQLLLFGLWSERFLKYNEPLLLLQIGRFADWNSKLSVWLASQSSGIGGGKNTFLNQALNPLFNYTVRGWNSCDSLQIKIKPLKIADVSIDVRVGDARTITKDCDYWITDPPYADAVNYHELGDYFVAWYQSHIPHFFPSWYIESKSPLALKGRGRSFNESMVECYRNMAHHMPDNGAQVVMFTHTDSAIWADLALILWASGLQVTSAWTIQTEVDAGGIKTGNYVKGTVCMVLRKQHTTITAFLSDIQSDVEYEVKEELRQMLEIEDHEDPNFSDADYQLAAYVAALRVITGYSDIEDIDVHHELLRTRQPGEVSEIQKIIDSAVAVACEYLVPSGFDQVLWRQLGSAERFYMKGLEVQSHGEYRNGVFMELARGFGLRDYKSFLKSGKANETRLMTGIEYGTKQLGDEGFGTGLLRNVLFAIRETYKEESPKNGRAWLYNQLPDYWGSKQKIIKLLEQIIRHGRYVKEWKLDIPAAELLKGYLEVDSV